MSEGKDFIRRCSHLAAIMSVRRAYMRLFYSKQKFLWIILLIFLFTIFFYIEPDNVLSTRISLKFGLGARSELADGTCRIPSIDPFDESIAEYIDHPKSVECRRIQPDFVYLDNDEILRLNRTEIDQYKRKSKSSNISCYYRYFDRGQNDREVKYEERRPLTKDTKLKKPFAKVVCRQGPNATRVFQNYFAHPIPFDSESKSSTHLSSDGNDFNIFIFGVESLSRSVAYRHLPKTMRYLEESGLIVFDKFHKVGENTKPNIAAVLTGKRARTEQEDMPSELSENSSHYDHWPFVWNEFKRKKGYETVYMEDSSSEMDTFHYGANGFKLKPTDHYYFTYWHAQQDSARELPSKPSLFCAGNRPQHQILLEILRKHLKQSKLSDRRQFVFSIANELSHDFSSDIERADEDFAKFFKQLDSEGALDRTILFVLGDHGPRFTEPRKTVVGFLEERLPFLGIRIPPSLNLKFPHLWETLNVNARQRLSSMFDLHETFLDILNQTFDGQMLEDRSIRGRSLFRPIPTDRRCFEAGVPDRYCLCNGLEVMPADHSLARPAADAVLAEANRQIRKFKDRCVQWKFEQIMYFFRIPWPGEDSGRTETYFVAFRVSPLKAIFEGVVVRKLVDDTIRYKTGTLERINKFGSHGNCLAEKHARLRKYCACNGYA